MGFDKNKQDEFDNEFIHYLNDMYWEFSDYFYKSDSTLYRLSFEEQLCVLNKYLSVSKDNDIAIEFSDSRELKNMRLIGDYNQWKKLDRNPYRNSAVFTSNRTLFLDVSTYGDDSYRKNMYDPTVHKEKMIEFVSDFVNDYLSAEDIDDIISGNSCYREFQDYVFLSESSDNDKLFDDGVALERKNLYNIFLLTNICSGAIIKTGEEYSFDENDLKNIVYFSSINVLNKIFGRGYARNIELITPKYENHITYDVFDAANRLSKEVISLLLEQCLILDKKGELDYENSKLSVYRERAEETNKSRDKYERDSNREPVNVLAGDRRGDVRASSIQGEDVSLSIGENREVYGEVGRDESEGRGETPEDGRISESMAQRYVQSSRDDGSSEFSDEGNNATRSAVQADSDFSGGNREYKADSEKQRTVSSLGQDNSREEYVHLSDSDVEEVVYNDFTYDSDWQPNNGTPLERFKRNIDAIKVLKELETSDSLPTYEQQVILSQYVGWGGARQVLVAFR